ncbi:MAG: hypothetical protein ACD_39C01865G0002 [uncultured bacterium]|nr:MAG: hypothetical protein ACD_39C01865G0002 [uncultured bacterium]
MKSLYNTLCKWRRAILYLFLLMIITGAWQLTIVSQTMQAGDQAAKNSLCKIERAPEFYELGKVEAGTVFFMKGPQKPISDFYQNPILILLDGSESRMWHAEDLKIVAGTQTRIFAPDKPWPDVATVSLYIRFKGVGQPLGGRPLPFPKALSDHTITWMPSCTGYT